MGGRGAYLVPYGFTKFDFRSIGYLDGIKIIKPIDENSNAKIPEMSNKPNGIYIISNRQGKYATLAIYGDDRRLKQAYQYLHSHKSKNKNGEIYYSSKIGHVHVHNIHGGWSNNVRDMTKKEIKKYGKILLDMGAKNE